jgi:hypothetical protein
MTVVIDIIKRRLKAPMSEAVISKGLKIFDHWNTPVAGSSPAMSMHSCPGFMRVCCIVLYNQFFSMFISPC